MASESPLDPTGDVSVVLVTYRSAEVLAECLASFEQHRPRRVAEVIVVDNSALPDLEPASTRFPWLHEVRNETDVHFRKGVNQGARLARGRYLFIFSPDAYLTEGESIARMAEVLDRDPRVGIVGPKTRGDDGLLAPQGERQAGLAYLIAQKTYLDALWPGNPLRRRHVRADASREVSGPVDTVAGSAMLCRRDEFLAAGGFDERATAYWEEQELARKLRRRGQHAFYLAEAFVFHHWRKGGSELDPPTVSRGYYEQAMRLYYEQFYGLPGRLLFDALAGFQRAVRGVRSLVAPRSA